MKKVKIAALVLLIVAVLGAAGGSVYLAYTMPPEEAEAYIEAIKTFAVERVVPIALSVLAGLGTILGILAPMMQRVKEAAGRFGEAVSSVQGTEASSQKATEAMAAWKAEMEAMQADVLARISEAQQTTLAGMDERQRVAYERLETEVSLAITSLSDTMKECVGRLDADHASVEATLEDAERIRAMLSVAFGNQAELVATGKSRKIAAIAAGIIRPETVTDGIMAPESGAKERTGGEEGSTGGTK